jgi:hypothetical protein
LPARKSRPESFFLTGSGEEEHETAVRAKRNNFSDSLVLFKQFIF